MPKEIYDETNPKYRCCCGCHVTTGTMIICLVYLFSYIAVMIHRVTLNYEPIIIVIITICAALVATGFGMGFLGAKNEKPKWLIPTLIVLACFVLFAIIDGLYGVWTFLTTQTPRMIFYENFDSSRKKMTWPYDNSEGKDTTLVIVVLILRTLIGIAFNSWLFTIVLRCYQYLIAKIHATNELPTYQQHI